MGKWRALTLGVLLGIVAVPASAIQIYALDALGNETLVSTTWNVAPTSPTGGTTVADLGGGTDWRVNVGVPNFGTLEGDSQTSAIYGAGTTLTAGTGVVGFRVKFRFDGYTWDSYNVTQPVNPGALDGYWDLFAVNINTGGYYWTLTETSDGACPLLCDPVVTPDPAGTPVISAGPLPGVTWGWGGLDYSGGFFEEEHNQFVIELLGLSLNSQVFVSAVLDTATLFDADDGLPSWGCFNSSVTDCPRPQGGTTQDPQVPLPGTLALVGLGLAGMALRRRPPSR